MDEFDLWLSLWGLMKVEKTFSRDTPFTIYPFRIWEEVYQMNDISAVGIVFFSLYWFINKAENFCFPQSDSPKEAPRGRVRVAVKVGVLRSQQEGEDSSSACSKGMSNYHQLIVHGALALREAMTAFKLIIEQFHNHRLDTHFSVDNNTHDKDYSIIIFWYCNE